MKVIASAELSFQIIQKHGLFYAQAFDIETMNLVFETECLTREGAAACLCNFLTQTLVKD